MTRLPVPGAADAKDGTLARPSAPKASRWPFDPLGEPISGALEEGDAPDLRRYWDLLLRRKWTLFFAAAVALVAGLVVTYNTTPIYRSSLSLQIEPPNIQLTGLQSETALAPSYSYRFNYQQTQIEVLRSRSLARRVIDQLGLEVSPRQPSEDKPSYLAELKRSIKGWLGEVHKSSGEKSGTKAANLEGVLLANLAIEPSQDSEVVRLTYDSPSPKQAAAVANAFGESFIAMNLERRYEASSHAQELLKGRIEQVRANLEDSERRLVAYAKEREMVDLDDKLGTLMQTLNTLNEQLTNAEAGRIKAESEYGQALKGAGPATLQIMESPIIQELKQRKGELELEYKGQPKIYKDDYPAKKRLSRQIAEVNQQIKTEVTSIKESIKAAYEAKVLEQAKLQERVTEIKDEILAVHDRSTDYQALKRDVETNRELYDGLLQRMKEVGVVAKVAANNVSILDRAQVPASPYKPDLRTNLLTSLGIGLVVGILLVLLFEHFDDTIKSIDDVEHRVKAPVLGIIPFVSAKHADSGEGYIALIAARNPRSPVAEATRSLRTSLCFSTEQGAPRIMHVTSSGAKEGKTTAAASMAISFAHAGSKVLLVDCDLRAPSLHHLFGLPNTSGLTNYLVGDAKPAHIAQATEVDRLFTITSGPLPPNPVELLAGGKMLDFVSLAADRFDYVILDSPPLMGLADSVVLSKLAQGTIFVVDAETTRLGALEGAIKRLREANANVIGAVIGRFGRVSKRYGYGYGYDYQYAYEYGDGAEAVALPIKT